jgi:hypothetical protein
MIVERRPEYRRVSFANALRFDLQELFNAPNDKSARVRLSLEQLSLLGVITAFPEELTVRDILQRRGQFMRNTQPGYWVSRFHKAYGEEDKLIVDDVRYPDEAEYIQERAGGVFRIIPYPGWKPGLFAEHESEMALDEWERWSGVIEPDYQGLEQWADYFAGVLP